MEVKKFEFPSFEEWWDNYYTKPRRSNFKTHIGMYTADVLNVVINLYGIYEGKYCLNPKSKEEVRNWYEQSIKELNDAFVKHIKETYLEEK